MEIRIDQIIQQFQIEGSFAYADRYGYGNINDTYVVYFNNSTNSRYVLQKINKGVFKSPEQVMENVVNITCFLKNKIIAKGGNPAKETLNIVPTKAGGFFYKDEDYNYWRVYHFIEGTSTYQTVENPKHFYQSGKAFGMFQKYLSDFPAESLYETIPDFHNTKKRVDAFMEALERDSCNRANMIAKEIDFVLKRASEAEILINMIQNNELPLRVTHNDTKFNNVMIDNETGEAVCVVDLDTVMPGLALYDYGDSIRSGANPAAEDERDLSKVMLDETLFEEFTRGYLEEAKEFLTPEEVEMLPFSAKLITFELGVRFLTDYLNGDTYFKTNRENHNLDRTRTQLKLVEDIENKFDKMKEIIKKYA